MGESMLPDAVSCGGYGLGMLTPAGRRPSRLLDSWNELRAMLPSCPVTNSWAPLWRLLPHPARAKPPLLFCVTAGRMAVKSFLNEKKPTPAVTPRKAAGLLRKGEARNAHTGSTGEK